MRNGPCENRAVDLAALIISGLGLAGSLIGFFIARRARREAAESERIAQEALVKSADAQANAAASLARTADSTGEIVAALRDLAARTSGVDSDERIAAVVNGMFTDVDLVRVFERGLDARVEWSIEERVEPHSYRLRNTGNVGAEDVQITAVPAEHAALLGDCNLGNLGAGEAGFFETSARLSLSLHRIAVSWTEADTRQQMSSELALP